MQSHFQKYWGRGYATKAIKLACDKLATEHSIKLIKAWCADENIASAKALERNGFVRKEIIESAINVCGEKYDQVIYEKVTMKIRKAIYAELDTILSVYAYAKQFMDEHGNPNQWAGENAITKEKVKLLIDRQQLFVGEENGKIQFVFAYILGEDPTYNVITEGAWLNDLPYGTIHRVASAGTSKGVVKMISDWALEQNPNLKIDTHHDNIVMQKALEKNGFRRCGIIFLGNGDPRIAYQKVKNDVK